jgi:hypothetical protein
MENIAASDHWSRVLAQILKHIPKSTIKIVWHEPEDVLTSSKTSQSVS